MSTTVTQEKTETLQRLAALKGIQTSYQSAFGTEVHSSPEALLAIMKALDGTELDPALQGAGKALARQETREWLGLCEPVSVLWEGGSAELLFRARAEQGGLELKIRLELESGEKREIRAPFEKLPIRREAEIQGKAYVERALILGFPVASGYHHAHVRLGKKSATILIISAPQQAYSPAASSKEIARRSTGIFAPLYALHSKESWGIGDFSDLGRFLEWSYGLGCDFVGTLPMLSLFIDKPMVEPSPYSPLSRLFWNELYVDPRLSAEWPLSKRAQKLVGSAKFKRKLANLQKAKQVDYQAVARLKRGVLEILAQEFFGRGGERTPEFREFLRLYPLAEDYAGFRAVNEKRNEVWRKWPERLRDGKLRPGDYRAEDKAYHLYAQFLAHQQLSSLSEKAKEKGRGVYIDFPLSAHADGYDVWREREAFGAGVSAGCPPDPAHVHGQDWGILPLNPQAIRESGYRYFRHCLESHMRYAGMLRLDHVMCFFRLYWVPHGLGAKSGVYVRYRLEEFFALLVLESHRHQCVLIGEDLGTVPPEIREAMTRHGILRMYVQQRRLAPDPANPLSDVPENCICSLNTHDMPPFAAFWKGLDIVDKMKLGYFGRKELPAKKKAREEQKNALSSYLKTKGSLKEILREVVLHTARQNVRVMQVNLEDLWLETLPQNVPGTWKERPNWRRRCRYRIEQLGKIQGIAGLFMEICQYRTRKLPDRLIGRNVLP